MEQESQWQQNDGQSSPHSMEEEVLSKVYSNVTLNSRTLARWRGIAMAEYVVQGSIKSAASLDEDRLTQRAIPLSSVLKTKTFSIQTRSPLEAHQRRSLRMMTHPPCGVSRII
jgi:hypothetical protein